MSDGLPYGSWTHAEMRRGLSERHGRSWLCFEDALQSRDRQIRRESDDGSLPGIAIDIHIIAVIDSQPQLPLNHHSFQGLDITVPGHRHEKRDPPAGLLNKLGHPMGVEETTTFLATRDMAHVNLSLKLRYSACN